MMNIPEIDYRKSLETSRSSITNAVKALAETGEIKVWLLTQEGDDTSLVCASLEGAMNAAVNMVADQLVHYDSENITNRMKMVDYITDDIQVRWKFPEDVRMLIGLYDIITITPDGTETTWSIRQQEMLP